MSVFKIFCTRQIFLTVGVAFVWVENIVGKGENDCTQAFSPFPQFDEILNSL